VLVLTTRSADRLQHILAVASGHARNPRRLLLYAAHLGDYLLQADPIGSPCFRDHRGMPVALVPAAGATRQRSPSPGNTPSGRLFPLPVATRPLPREARPSGLPSLTS
jgi:hypothetical protein